MINNIISGYLMNKLINEGHPVIDYDYCANKKQRRKICTICQDVCPETVISRNESVKWDNCINCNICAVLCPSRAIRSSVVNIRKILESYQVQSDNVVITCRRQSASADLKLYCAASAPWEVIACIALEKQVVLLKPGCENCPDSGYLSALDASLQRVEEFLGAELYRERVLLANENRSLPEKQLSRRELFSFFTKKAKGVVSAALPEDDSEWLDGMLYRRILVRRLQALNETDRKPVYGWRTLVFTDKCWGCGVCEKVCPREAVSAVELDGEKYMAHNLWKCEGCGACESVCLENGLSGMRLSRVEDPLQPVLTEISYTACNSCGQPVKPGTGKLCMRCAPRSKLK